MDFTLMTYSQLLDSFQQNGYSFWTFAHYCKQKDDLPVNLVMLRHDVDLRAENSLSVAKIEAELGIKASYYFRVVPQSNKPLIIKEIALLGHEIGYHYEDMAICEGDADKAIAHFENQLAYFRQFYPVETVCMHGAPRSRFDGKELWKRFDYHNFGIIGEPYFDTDFSKLFYLTDTGRRWDGFNVSVRDRIPKYQDEWMSQGLTYHSTDQIVDAVLSNVLPKRLMMTTHPQRWTDDKMLWLKELLSQSLKNVVKRTLIRQA